MITYVDTSTLLKLVVDEAGSDTATTIWRTADHVASVALVVVESRAALSAAARAGRLSRSQLRSAVGEVDRLLADLHLIQVTDELIANAAEVAEREALRGYDAIRLSAALLVGATVLTSADTDLCDAALRRGLHVANPLTL